MYYTLHVYYNWKCKTVTLAICLGSVFSLPPLPGDRLIHGRTQGEYQAAAPAQLPKTAI
jgi:hypothetical protein